MLLLRPAVLPLSRFWWVAGSLCGSLTCHWATWISVLVITRVFPVLVFSPDHLLLRTSYILLEAHPNQYDLILT